MEMEKEDKRALLEIAKQEVLDHLDKARRQGLRRHRLFAQDPKVAQQQKKEVRINLPLGFLLRVLSVHFPHYKQTTSPLQTS